MLPESASDRVPKRKQRARAPLAERKQITALFVDLCRSTELIAGTDPESAHRILSAPIQLMKTIVRTHGGYVSQVLGDGLVALFGVPLTQEDHALRACRAAVELQVALRGLRVDNDPNRPPMQIRVGINSGEGYVRFDSELRSYQADGPVMHLASRLERLALPGTVLIGGSTYRLARRQVDAISLGLRAIRGFDNKVDLYELALSRGRFSSAAWAHRDRLGPLIGRDEPMSRLHAAADEARAGRLRIVGLRGEAGIGKSRIVAEFCDQIRTLPFSVVALSVRTYTNQTPYSVVAGLLRELMDIAAETDVESEKQSARRIVDSWVDLGERHRPAAVDLLGLGDPGAGWLALAPAQRKRRICDLLHWVIAAKLGGAPLAIVIEDIFLADRESQRLLETLFRRLAEAPVLVLTTYRPAFAQRWSDEVGFSEMFVGPLTESETSRLARSMLGEDPSLEPVLIELLSRADGNPFFLEQMALALVNDGTLIGSPGAYRCARESNCRRVPDSIAALIGAQVDNLPIGAKASLEAAAVLGDPVRSELVAAMRGVDAETADDHLHTAVLSGLLNGALGGESACYEFRHALVQEAVYAALTGARRRELHRDACEALCAVLGDATTDRAGELVQHAYQGEAWAQAAQFARQAMSRSVARSAYRDALRVLEIGLDALRRLEGDAAALPLELALRLEAPSALLPLGQMDEIVSDLERAESITRLIGDTRHEASVLVQLAVVFWTRGNYVAGLAAARKAGRAARAAGRRSLQMAAAQATMMLKHGLGRYPQVVGHARAIQDVFAIELQARRIMSGWAVIAAVNVRIFLADALRRMGQHDAALQACREAYRELDGTDQMFSRLMVDFVQATLWLDEGRCAEAAALLRSALEACETHDVPTMYPAIVAALGGAMARSGSVGEAVALLEKASADKVQRAGGRYNDFYLPLNLALALAAAGRLPEGTHAAAAAASAAAKHRQRGHEAEALLLLGQLQAAAGNMDDARTSFLRAGAIGRKCAMAEVVLRAQTAEALSIAEWARVPNRQAPASATGCHA